MNDLETAMKDCKRNRLAQSKRNKYNKGIVFDALAAAKITEVHLNFDGSCDSGQLEGLTALRGEEQVDLPDTTVPIRCDGEPLRHTTLEVAIETLCYDYLEQTQGGWENDEGAYGEFYFNVASRAIKLEFNFRYTGVDTHNLRF
jgi:hypothetical protein